jgi:uncharacterized protein DUF4832
MKSSWQRAILTSLIFASGLPSCTRWQRPVSTAEDPVRPHTTAQEEIHPASAEDAYLMNPGIGWQRDGEPHSPVDLPEAVAYGVRNTISWNILNPAEGTYDWSALDADIEQASSQGELYSFRIYTMAGEGLGGQKLPNWVGAEGAVILPSGEPDYSNCVYQQKWGEFVNALVDRYDGNPHLAFIDISGYGDFNEWSWGDETEWDPSWKIAYGNGTASAAAFQTLDGQARRRLADMFIGGAYSHHACRNSSNDTQIVDYAYRGFRVTQLVMPFGGINQSSQYIQSRRADVGFRYDCLGREKDQALVLGAAGDIWRHAPVVFELCNPTQFTMDSARQVLQEAHGSLVHNNGFDLDAQDLQNLMRYVGYRYVLQSAKVSEYVQVADGLALTMVWQNVGSAPAYAKMGQDFRLHVYLVSVSSQAVVVDESVPADIGAWMPAAIPLARPPENTIVRKLQLPGNLQSGTYAVKVALLDQRTGLPIQLALQARDGEGRYLVTNVYVSR